LPQDDRLSVELPQREFLSLDGLLPREFPGGRLRRLAETDLERFQAYRGLPELGRYQGWSPLSDAAARTFLVEMNAAARLSRGEWVQIGIAEPEYDRLLGDIGLHVAEDGGTGEIGFTLEPAAQGRGIATAAVREALQLLFAASKVARVLGITDARNRPSIRLLERVGFECYESRGAIFREQPCIEKVYVLPRRIAGAGSSVSSAT
jgi:ribosomal-protein-alanine N-acetyltransferase